MLYFIRATRAFLTACGRPHRTRVPLTTLLVLTLSGTALPVMAQSTDHTGPDSEADSSPSTPADTHERARNMVLLASLIRERAHQDAFELAENLRSELEGEPDFDVLYARAALNVGETQRAVFALERVTLVQPRRHDVRLSLVGAYLAQGNTAAARRQLDRLEGQPLTAAQRTRWDFLDRTLRRQRLEAQQSSAFTLGAELQYDTNINRGLNRSSLIIEPAEGPDFEFNPDEDAQAEGAPALQLQGSYQRSTPLNQRLRRNWQIGATTRQSPYADAINYGGLFSVGLEHRNGRSGTLQVLPAWNTDGFQLTTQASGVQRDIYGSLNLGASLAWTMADSQSALLQTQVTDDFEISAVRTDWQVGLSANLSDHEQQNYLGFGGALRPLWRPAGRFVYQGTLGLQTRFYLEDSPIYGNARRDLQLNSELLVMRPLTEASVLTGRIAYNHLFSNQGLYEYYGGLVATGYQYTW